MLAKPSKVLQSASLLFAFYTISVHAAASCYNQPENHTLADPAIYIPCNTNTPYSMCYRVGSDDLIPAAPDIGCLPNGLAVGDGGNNFWRQSCTDQSWESPYCLNSFNGCPANNFGDLAVTPCGSSDSTAWCCGINNITCCGTNDAITILKTLGVSSTSSTSSSTSSTSSTVSPTATHAPSKKGKGSGLSSGAKAGIGIGVALGVLALLAVAVWAVFRKRKQARGMAGSAKYPGGEAPPYQPRGEGAAYHSHPMNEVKKTMPEQTLPEQQPLYEADAGNEIGRYQDIPVAELGTYERTVHR